METLQRKPKYSWPNRLSFEDRKAIIDYYNQGYAVYTITKAFNTTQTTVEYHLKKEGVFVLYRKATKQGPIVRQLPMQLRALAFPSRRRLVTKLDNDEYWYDEYGQQYKNVTKSYADFLKEAATRPRIIRDNERMENKGAGNNFITMIRVDLTNHQSSGPSFIGSVLSW